MLTVKQKKVLKYTENKVRELFVHYDAPAHGLDHVERVHYWINILAKKEKAGIFLCNMVALLHDIGRTREKKDLRPHAEISYDMCREWFKDDAVFNDLTKQEKIEILYAIRYHWNDAADKYITADLLRDADKMDTFGKIGVKRAIEYWQLDEKGLKDALRMIPNNLYWLKTKTAQRIVKQENLLKPVMDFYFKLLKKDIKDVEL